MNSDIINSTRLQHSIATPWEFTLFKQISGQNHDANYIQQIDIDILLDAYVEFMTAHGVQHAPREWIHTQLHTIKLPIGMLIERVGDKSIIKYQEYTQTLRWVISLRKHYGLVRTLSSNITNGLLPPKVKWAKYGLVAIMTAIDIFAVIIIIFIKMHIPFWLIIARSFAAIILTNILFVLVPSLGISSIIPDSILARGFPTEYAGLYHTVAGVKILVASIGHTIAHILQIERALVLCKDGCMQKSIRIVAKSANQTIISRSYFWAQYPYYTGIMLLVIFGVLGTSLMMYRQRLIRFSTNRMVHQYMAFAGFVMTIAHGGQQLLGLNYSYILTLPILLVYGWHRRHTVFPFRVKIDRWVITSTTIRLYLQDNKRFNAILNSFDNVIIHINYPRINKIEWHPFTLTRGHGASNATITMKRIGAWTNKLATTLLSRVALSDNINISHYSLSKFRFHRLYDTRYFFCAGVGITAFLAAMSDTMRIPLNSKYQTVFAWSVSDVRLVAEFGRHLLDIQSQLPNIKIMIFYSNRAISTQGVSHDVRIRFEYLQALLFGSKQIDIATKVQGPICILFQRIDFVEILSKAVISANASTDHIVDPIGVFICGPQPYAQSAITSTELIMRNKYNIQFTIWSESV